MNNRALRLDNKPLQWGLMAGLGVAFMLASTMSAKAKILCKGEFQVVKGAGEIATPWCADNYLTQIARADYGWKVSAKTVRYNPGLKARICRHIGHDSRLVSICSGHRFDNGRGTRSR